MEFCLQDSGDDRVSLKRIDMDRSSYDSSTNHSGSPAQLGVTAATANRRRAARAPRTARSAARVYQWILPPSSLTPPPLPPTPPHIDQWAARGDRYYLREGALRGKRPICQSADNGAGRLFIAAAGRATDN
ncbi:unnamed protein product, partial [Iphiclides podalirius]